jgi:hypothetical protein
MEAHLEAMKATYLLNQDKLVYNERVLQERASESQTTILHQRRKLARQREVLALLKVTSLLGQGGLGCGHPPIPPPPPPLHRKPNYINSIRPQGTF